MNRKFLLHLVFAAIAAVFVACGGGDGDHAKPAAKKPAAAAAAAPAAAAMSTDYAEAAVTPARRGRNRFALSPSSLIFALSGIAFPAMIGTPFGHGLPLCG